jgi:hypothetical protein
LPDKVAELTVLLKTMDGISVITDKKFCKIVLDFDNKIMDEVTSLKKTIGIQQYQMYVMKQDYGKLNLAQIFKIIKSARIAHEVINSLTGTESLK